MYMRCVKFNGEPHVGHSDAPNEIQGINSTRDELNWAKQNNSKTNEKQNNKKYEAQTISRSVVKSYARHELNLNETTDESTDDQAASTRRHTFNECYKFRESEC